MEDRIEDPVETVGEAPLSEPKKTPKLSKAAFTYQALIKNFPRPGGEGAHHAFFKAGALGFKAGVPADVIVKDIRSNIRPGGRTPSETEIVQGVQRGFEAALEESTGIRKPPKRSLAKVSEGAFAKIAAAKRGATIESIMARSPVSLDFPEPEAGWRTLEALYEPDDLLYIGPFQAAGSLGSNIRSATEWIAAFKSGCHTSPFIIPNPLTGLPGPVKDGTKETLIGDSCVAKFRHMVVEMDRASLEDQLAFWSYAALPVRALIMSGGKSIHAWVDVDCSGVEEWEREVEQDLYPAYLIPLGHDANCINESRKSRFPGHLRNDEKVKGVMQKLIWLSPEGKAVCE